MACRYCDLRGIYNNHVYYPTTPPSNVINETYNPSNLPKRTHRDYKTRIEQIEKILPSRTRNALASDLGNNLINIVFFAAKLTIIILKIGITGRSVLLDIKTTQFPACFPIDIMHLFYENIALYMLKHWMGSFLKILLLMISHTYSITDNGMKLELKWKLLKSQFQLILVDLLGIYSSTIMDIRLRNGPHG